MALILLKIGIVCIPFFELIFRFFPFVSVQSPDTRAGKMTLGLLIALSIGLAAIYNGTLKRCQNRWLLFLLFYIPISINLAPKVQFTINNVSAINFWAWKPFLIILVYFIMFLAVQSLNITRKNLKCIFNVLVWTGAAMSIYMILQSFGWEQFFFLKSDETSLKTTQNLVVGNLGQPTIVAPFVAMIVPIALYLRKYLVMIVLVCAVIATHSIVAISSMAGCLIVYSLIRCRFKALIALLIIGILSVGAISVYRYAKPKEFTKISKEVLDSNGRFGIWKESIRILKEEKIGGEKSAPYPYTGVGLGSYEVIFAPMIPLVRMRFAQVHNEYIQVMCELGIIGLFLFLAAIGSMFNGVIWAFIAKYNREEVTVLFCSFLCIAVVAVFSFPWQIPPIIFNSVLIAGLLSNQSIIGGGLNE